MFKYQLELEDGTHLPTGQPSPPPYRTGNPATRSRADTGAHSAS